MGLRRRGIDVTTTVEAGLLQASDPQQIGFATAKQRVFVTRERSILAAIHRDASHAGIAVARSGRRNIGPTVLSLTRLHRTTAAEEMMGRIEYL